MDYNDFVKRVESIASHILFDYNGKTCGIDPLSRSKFDMWYVDVYITVDSADKVMNTPFFDEKTLTEIFNHIENIET